jgi:hypothetical protein
MIYTEVAKATKVAWEATQPIHCVARLLVANKQIFTEFLPVMQALTGIGVFLFPSIWNHSKYSRGFPQ